MQKLLINIQLAVLIHTLKHVYCDTSMHHSIVPFSRAVCKLCLILRIYLGPNDPGKFITADDNSADCQNAKVERVLFPDSDYYVLIRTFDADGGEFRLSITAT